MRRRSPHQRSSQSIPKRRRDLLREALARTRLAIRAPVGSSRKNSVRMKKRPPLGSEEYWCEETMLRLRSNRKPETAATIPGRSGAGDQQAAV